MRARDADLRPHASDVSQQSRRHASPHGTAPYAIARCPSYAISARPTPSPVLTGRICYARTARCPVLTARIWYQAAAAGHAESVIAIAEGGGDINFVVSVLRTDTAYGGVSLRDVRYCNSVWWYEPTPCPVPTKRMVV
eukprot:1385089-Rhodomonas_salina.2